MKKFYITIVSLLLAVLPLAAQITVEVPGVVGLNEKFNITFVMTDSPSDFEWNPGENFQLLWGPQTGSSTSVSMINGKVTKNSRHTYTYVLLPKSNGVFTLPAAQAKLKGETIYSRAPKIEVVSDGASSGSQQQGGQQSGAQQGSAAAPAQAQQGASGSAGSPSNNPESFMRFSLNRTSVVQGEPITATLKLYTRESISGFEDAKFPTFNGFWAQEIESPQNISFNRESVGDKIYNAAVLRRWVIIPQKSGTINIDPAELSCVIQQRVSSGNSVFDGFFDDYQTIKKKLTSASYAVKVSPLPAGAPASFTGAVGKYTIKASLNKDSLKVHDAASLTVVIAGKGNVALVGAPKVKFPPDSEVYDTKSSESFDAGSGGTSGSKTFEFPFIPRSHGDFSIEPIEFSYFDINSRKYVTIKTPEIKYNVAPGEASDYVSPSGITIASNRGKDVKNLAEDIHFIETKIPVLSSEGKFFVGTPLFWILLTLFIVLGTAAYFVISKFRAVRNDVVLVRTKAASKLARKRLAVAGGYLAKNLYTPFFAELHKALLGYASDKLNIPAADLSKESIASAFVEKGIPQDIVTRYTDLLDKCEYARYAPDSSQNALQESYDDAVDVISLIDDNMKNKTSKKKAAKTLAILALILPAMGGIDANAQNGDYVDSLWVSAVNAYSDGNYSLARQDFGAIAELGLSSPELYTNLADACFKNRELGSAILYYERALKLDPSYKDAKYNIEIARAQTQDRIESVPEFFLTTWNRKLCYTLSSDVWATLALAFAALTVILVLVFLLSRRSVWRKTGFFSAIVTLLVFVVCLADALWQKNDFNKCDKAIVTIPVCSAKSTPSGSSNVDLFVIHEGTKVNVLDNVGQWTNIELADGREGWVYTNCITVI